MVFAAGETWTSLDTTSLTVAGNGLAYGNGSFVATNCSGGTGNEFLRSSNGTTWTMSGAVADICMTSVAYGAGKFVATSRYDRNIHVSSDGGASWTVIDPGEPNRAEWTSITYGGGQFIAVSFFPGRKILRSTDAVTWTAIDADAASSATDGTQWRDVAYGNNRFVGISHFSRSLVSTDGLTWSLTQSLPVSAYDIAFGNGVFVAVSTAGVNRIMTSADGVTWSVPSVSSAIATTAWSDVTWDPGGSQFVAVGNGSVMTSPDGTTWTMGVAASGNSWQTVIAGASMLVSMSSNGTNNRIMTAGTYSFGSPTTTTVAPTTTTVAPTTTTTVPASTTTVVSSTTTIPAATTTVVAAQAPTTTVAPSPVVAPAGSANDVSTGNTTVTKGATIPRTGSTPSTVAPTTTTTTTTTTTIPAPDSPDAAPGEAGATVDGEAVTTEIERKDNALVVSAAAITAKIFGTTPDGERIALDADGNLQMKTGDSVVVEASGYEPGTRVEIWLRSTPVKLGQLEVDSTGAVRGRFELPPTVTSGDHRVILSGTAASGADSVIGVGLRIGAYEKEAGISPWLIVIPVLLAVSAALVLPTTLRRRRRTA